MCVIMGLVKRKEISVRNKEIEDFIFFTENLKNDIFYRKLPVDKIIAKNELEDLNLFFKKMAESPIQPISKRYYSVKSEVMNKMSLSHNEWRFSDELFSVLGKTDESSQYEILDRLLKDLREHKKEITAKNEKMVGFYMKMWLAVGTLFVVICI